MLLSCYINDFVCGFIYGQLCSFNVCIWIQLVIQCYFYRRVFMCSWFKCDYIVYTYFLWWGDRRQGIWVMGEMRCGDKGRRTVVKVGVGRGEYGGFIIDNGLVSYCDQYRVGWRKEMNDRYRIYLRVGRDGGEVGVG